MGVQFSNSKIRQIWETVREIPLMNFLNHFFLFQSIYSLLALSGNFPSFGFSISILSRIQVMWIIFNCLAFLVPRCLATLQHFFTIYRIVQHSFLSPSITYFLGCTKSIKFRLRLSLRVNDSNGHHQILVCEGTEQMQKGKKQ